MHADRIGRLADQGVVELVAAVDPGVVLDPPTIYGADLYADLAEALNAAGQVDVVVIAAPLSEHFHLARTALTAGADVYLEKPPVTSMEDFTRLLDLEQETGRVIQVGFQSLGSHALAMLRADEFGIGPVSRIGALGAWSRTVGYWSRSSWSGRRSLRGRAVVDGVITNPLAHSVATALAVVDCRTMTDVDVVETDLYRANRIDSDDTSVVRIRATSGQEVTCALSLCAPVQQEPQIHIEGANGRIRFAYTSDRIDVVTNDQTRTETTGRTDLFENLLAHRRDGSELLVPLASTGAFMRVLAAVADADEPTRIDPRAIRWEGEDQDRRAVVEDIDNWLERAVSTSRTFAELRAPWAHQERDTILVRAEIGGAEVAQYVDGRGTIPTSSPRPYLHPARTLAGVVLTARHPADHDWHLGIGMAVPDVNGSSFWGGGTYIHDKGYVLLDNHGEINSEALQVQENGFRQRLNWVGHDGSVELRERRSISWAAVERSNLEVDLRVSTRQPRETPRSTRRAAKAARAAATGVSPGGSRSATTSRCSRPTRAASTTCTAVSPHGWRGRPISPPGRVSNWTGHGGHRRSGSGCDWRALVRPGQRLPGHRLGARLGSARVATMRATSLTRRFDISIADGRLTEGEVGALALAQGAG